MITMFAWVCVILGPIILLNGITVPTPILLVGLAIAAFDVTRFIIQRRATR